MSNKCFVHFLGKEFNSKSAQGGKQKDKQITMLLMSSKPHSGNWDKQPHSPVHNYRDIMYLSKRSYNTCENARSHWGLLVSERSSNLREAVLQSQVPGFLLSPLGAIGINLGKYVPGQSCKEQDSWIHTGNFIPMHQRRRMLKKKLILFCSVSVHTHLHRNAGEVLFQEQQHFPHNTKIQFHTTGKILEEN